MEEEPKKDPNEWALAYGDMITLLMTFFVLIIAMSSPKTDDEVEMMKKGIGTGDNLIVAELKDSGIFKEKVRSKTKIMIEADDLLPPISDLELIREDMVVIMTENELFDLIDLLRTNEGFMIMIRA